jgi:hypothetical protein
VLSNQINVILARRSPPEGYADAALVSPPPGSRPWKF